MIKTHHKSATKGCARDPFGKTIQVAAKPARIIAKVFKLSPVAKTEFCCLKRQ